MFASLDKAKENQKQQTKKASILPIKLDNQAPV